MDRIKQVIEALGRQQQCDEDGVVCLVSRQAVEEARAMLGEYAAEGARLREDAERYRWLRGKARAEGRDGGHSGLYSLPHIPAWDTNIHNTLKQRGYHYATLDAAIDAARAAP